MGTLIRSQVAGVVGILIWSLFIEPIIGGVFTSLQPYLPYTAATTLVGAQARNWIRWSPVNVNHGRTPAVAPPPLPFGAAVALLGALVIVVSVIAARSRLRADITY